MCDIIEERARETAEKYSVPAATKADAVREVVTTENIDENCPATIMRKHDNAVMYCDVDSGKHIV